jgi:hypothetical protein
VPEKILVRFPQFYSPYLHLHSLTEDNELHADKRYPLFPTYSTWGNVQKENAVRFKALLVNKGVLNYVYLGPLERAIY